MQHVESLAGDPWPGCRRCARQRLFESRAGETVRRNLLGECEVHALLCLPTRIFYAPGVKANVVFFDRKPGVKEPWGRVRGLIGPRINKSALVRFSEYGIARGWAPAEPLPVDTLNTVNPSCCRSCTLATLSHGM